MIASNVPCVDGASQSSEWREVALTKREDVPALLDLIKATFGVHRPFKVMGEASVNIQPLAWEDLVLDDSVVRLVGEDYHLSLEREDWYKRQRLPFRRGYSWDEMLPQWLIQIRHRVLNAHTLQIQPSWCG